MSWLRFLCRVIGHRWTRPTSDWRVGHGLLGKSWSRDTECRVCGAWFIEWQTWNPRTGTGLRRGRP